MKKQGHIFISYQSGETDFALRIAADLRNSGVNIWMDRLDMGIRPSQDWRLSIETALTSERCSGMVAILSPAYLVSRYCRNELARADRLGIQIYPVILSPFADTQWPLEVERLQYIDFREWQNEKTYQNKFTSLSGILKELFPHQHSQSPDPETRYLTNLIAELEGRQGVANYVEMEGETTKISTRPSPPVDEETGYLVLINKDSAKETKRKQIHIKKISDVTDIYPCFVLIGSPGAGKTTVIRNMVLDLARKKLDKPRAFPIPMIAYLPQWQDNWSFEEFLKANWPLNSNPLELLKRKELVLYLDGLNEMGSEKLSKVNELRSWLSNPSSATQVIVTCRRDDYNDELNLGNIPVVNIKQLSESQIRQFAKRYLGKGSKKFLAQILPPATNNIDKRGFLPLITNPYFLTAFIIIYNNTPDEELPKNSGTLFKKLVEALWAREEKRKSAVAPFEVVEAEFARLAFAMIDSDMPVDVSREYALLFMKEKKFLTIGQSASFLVDQNNSIRFYHQLIQEYFAAIGLERVGISHIRLDKNLLRSSSGYSNKSRSYKDNWFETFPTPEYRRASKWDQVIISLCGFVQHPEDIIKKVARIDPLLAADCLLSGIDISLDNVFDAFYEALNDKDATLRKAALVALGKIDRDKSIPHFAKALEDKDTEVRTLATNLLIQLGDIAIPYFANHLKTTNEERAILSIQALTSIGISAIPTLADILDSDINIDIKIRACNTLGGIRHKDSVDILLSFLKSKDKLLVTTCIIGLGNIGDPSSVSKLIRLLNTIPTREITLKTALVESLGNIRRPEAIPTLVDLIKNESWELHLAAFNSLKKIATLSARTSIKAFELLNSKNRKTKENAIATIQNAYGTIGLVHGLRHPNKSYWEIAHKLTELPEEDFKILVKARNDKKHHLQAMIAYCIGERKDKKYENILISLLDEGSSFVRGITIEALGKVKCVRAIPQLTKFLQDRSRIYSNSKKRVCDNAAIALLEINTKESTSKLNAWALSLINGRIANGQETPLIVLSKIGNNEAVPRLAKILKHQEYYARRALKGIGTPEALEVIEEFDKKLPS